MATAKKPLSAATRAAAKSGATDALPAAVDTASRARKPKLVRDSFTMPKAEYAAIEALKQRAQAWGAAPKKSELLRAGVLLLSSLGDAPLKRALAAVPALKTGRPKTEIAPAALPEAKAPAARRKRSASVKTPV